MGMFNSAGQPTNMEALINAVTSLSGASAVFMVSSVTQSGSTNAISANQQLSAVLLAGTANIGYVSAFVDNGSLSAKSSDAGTFRVSAIGGTAGDRTIVDGADQTISARIKQISAVLSASDNALIVHAVSEGAGRNQVSAKSGDAGLLRVSALNQDANFMHISGFNPDAGLFLISAKQGDAGLLRTSSFVDSGSVSAKSGDANQVHVSSVQGDAGLLRVSGFTATAANFPVSSTQADASLLRVSSLGSVVTTSTGGASFFSTSAGIAQVSTIKSSAGRLYGYHLEHGAGVDQFLQIFNTSGGATLGTDVPSLVLGVPAGTGTNVGAGAIMSLGVGIAFGTGIQIAVTSTRNGNTAGASAMNVNLFYA